MNFQVWFACANLATFIAYPFGFIEMNCVHMVLEIWAVGECLLTEWTLGHKLCVRVGKNSLEVNYIVWVKHGHFRFVIWNKISVLFCHKLSAAWCNFHNVSSARFWRADFIVFKVFALLFGWNSYSLCKIFFLI